MKTILWAVPVILALAASAVAAELRTEVDESIARHLESIVELRHRIHANPELGNEEHETAALVAAHLRELGLEVETGVAVTGVVGVLEGGLPGPVVAVRADMDALPVTEETDFPFRSTKRTVFLDKEVGVAHACGHDIHTAVGLGVASVLAELRDRLPGTVKFIFQPAEEGLPFPEEGGARLMVEEGVLRDPAPEAIFGLHSQPDLAIGELGFRTGAAMASVDHFLVTLRGTQAHGAWPHLSVDPIVMASQAVLALQTIPSRSVRPLDPTVVTVGIFRGGERFNIIPAEVRLEGTVRTYGREVQQLVRKRMEEILTGITQAAGGGSFELEYRTNAPATINDEGLAVRMLPSLRRIAGEDRFVEVEPVMGGEDFAYFSNEIPGFYFWLGVLEPGTTSGGLHTPSMRAGDGAVGVGMRAMAGLVVDYLSGR